MKKMTPAQKRKAIKDRNARDVAMAAAKQRQSRKLTESNRELSRNQLNQLYNDSSAGLSEALKTSPTQRTGSDQNRADDRRRGG